MARLHYLSLAEYVQHAHAAGAPEADAFNRAIDDRVRRLVELGAVVGLVADHGMNDKARPNGEPNVIFLEDELNRRFEAGAVRVICRLPTRSWALTAASGPLSGASPRGAAEFPALMAAGAEWRGGVLVLGAANCRTYGDFPGSRPHRPFRGRGVAGDLSITDPFVRHHGALGSFVRVYAQGAAEIPALMAASAELPGVALVLDAANTAQRFELPLDREGDFVVLGDANTAIGSSSEEHDLSGLVGHRLAWHGRLG